MANSTFLPPGITDNHTASNPYPCPNYMNMENYCNYFPGFDLSDFLAFENNQTIIDEDASTSSCFTTTCDTISQAPIFQQQMTISTTGSGSSASSTDGMPINNNILMQGKCKRGINKKSKTVEGHTIAFRMRTELETLKDGYKWRKYGKKMVKSNPNPRNYYKCSTLGCKVKKRVERDGSDSSYLITTYDGIHNHQSPYVMYYDELPMPFDFPVNGQAKHHMNLLDHENTSTTHVL